jgi:hypothetical protein
MDLLKNDKNKFFKINEQTFKKFLMLITLNLDVDVRTIITKKIIVISIVELLKNERCPFIKNRAV